MKVLFATLHAKYVHASLALPYLAAACATIPGVETAIVEMTVNEQQDQLLSRLYAEKADVVLFSCYIWNTELTLRLASDLKQLTPAAFMVLGGPEVSFGAFDMMVRNSAIDCIVRGEGEETCRELLEAVVAGAPLDGVPGITYREGEEIVATPERGAVADLDAIPSPFEARLVDLAKPLVYYETSRGCPFSCAFCMSSIGSGVRSFSMERIKSDLLLLMGNGVQTVKLADRTFNYDAKRADEIWRFILDHNRGSKFHFEIAAELLTAEAMSTLAAVPPEIFRFEIGVQSGGEETLAKVERNSSLARLFANVKELKAKTQVTVHLDLVAGLPGETFEGFLDSLESLFGLGADHIQVEPLKVLKGTRMRSIARKEGYAYAEAPPYKILQTPWLSFNEIRRIEGISRLLDQVYNSGRFRTTVDQLASWERLSTLFSSAAEFFESSGIAGTLSLPGLFEAVWRFLASRFEGEALERVRDVLTYDYCLTGYPGGNTPTFFKTISGKGERGAPTVLAAANPGERVRYYRRPFLGDYRRTPWSDKETEVTFVYRSAPGQGLRVEVF